jgi:hypothetical protein
MRRWLILAVHLYPPRWRARYGEEFRALLEDVRPGWRALADVLRGALIMQITDGTAFLKLAAALSVAGALVAVGVSFTMPPRYVSSAKVSVTAPKEDADEYDRYSFEQMEEQVLSRGQLGALIQQPGLDLYKGWRQRMPFEEVIQRMRRDLQVRQVSPSVYSISFAYPDKEKAQEVTRQLAAKFYELNLAMDRNRARIWRQLFPQSDPPPGRTITVIDAAGQPEKSAGGNPLVFAAWGVLLGAVAALAVWRPKSTLRLAAYAAAGCAVAFAVSFLFPETYTSTAVMRFAAAKVPVPAAPMAERFQQMERQVLSADNLTRIIRYVKLDLDLPQMRRAIQIQPANADPATPGFMRAFRITFSYSERFKCKQVADNLVAGFMEKNTVLARAFLKQSGDNPLLANIFEHMAGEVLEVLDPASLPEAPVSPNRALFAGLGLALGLLLGLITPRRPATASLAPAHAT